MVDPRLRPAADDDTRPEFVTMPLDRRRFLLLAAGAAAAATLPGALARAAQRAPRFAAPRPWTLPETLPAGALEAAQALIAASILAPSYWNTQPWRFEVDGGTVRLTLDRARAMPACDPDQRFAQISLGAALENLLVAARAWGQQPVVQYLPWGPAARASEPLVAASVTWAPAETRRDRDLFHAIAARRSNPRHFDGRAITLQHRSQLLAQVPNELALHWLDDHAEIRRVAALVHDATLARAHDLPAQRERCRWVRFNDGDERGAGDGVPPERLSLGGPLAGMVARALRPGSHLFAWGIGTLAHEAGDATRTAGALALLTAPKHHDATWLLGGQAYERLALKATALGIAQQPLSAPIESEPHRAQLAQRFGAAGEEPLLLVRLGHAHAPAPTARRGVALVSTWHTS